MNTNSITNKTIDFLSEVATEKFTLGKLIHSIRLGEEISQIKFANILGISRQQLCDIEHDRKIISPKLAAKYADILGYSQSQFIRLALQSIVDRDSLNVTVDIHFRNTKKQSNSNKSSASIVRTL